MRFKDTLKSDKFIITMDTIPPKGTDLSEIFKRIDPLKGRVDGINVVDMPSAVMRMGSLPLSHLLKEKGFEPILQITCRDRNRLSLQADLLSACALGVENLLILSGDNIELSDDPNAKSVFDLDAIELLKVAKGLEVGHDMAGNKLHGSPAYCLGAAVDPGEEPLDAEIEKMEKKVRAGAEFFQTQPVFDIDLFADFIKKIASIKTSILAGVFLLKSSRMAKYMNNNVPGVRIPEYIIETLEEAHDPEEKGIQIAVDIIESLRGYANGVHIMTVNWEDKIQRILDVLRL